MNGQRARKIAAYSAYSVGAGVVAVAAGVLVAGIMASASSAWNFVPIAISAAVVISAGLWADRAVPWLMTSRKRAAERALLLSDLLHQAPNRELDDHHQRDRAHSGGDGHWAPAARGEH
ncbi:hypothetical protein SAMN05216174_106297 [Actinokineospora iranica]|uniref:Uncharacterized protein n=1 Tax=Actinokineospora iranica TaxID=1271860 RepID=A0A1G6RDW6_9PSEU|nr:hypothetical protein SAMN05216174_106297 [Actinokineospora iranica]